MVLVERSNLRSHVNDTTFHSFRSAHACKKPAGGLKKHKRVVLFSPLAREKAFSLFLLFSLSFSDDFERANDDSIEASSHQSQREEIWEAKFQTKTLSLNSYLLYLGSSLSRCRWYPKTPLRAWWLCPLRFSRKFASSLFINSWFVCACALSA